MTLVPPYAIRLICNDAIANHPTIQVAAPKGEMNFYNIGFLGLLNGLFGIRDNDGFGAITMQTHDDGSAQFVRTDSWKGDDTPTESGEDTPDE